MRMIYYEQVGYLEFFVGDNELIILKANLIGVGLP